MPSDEEIKTAFNSGDGDNDDGLSLSEASEALQKLTGKSIDESTIEAACNALGVSTSSEMNLEEFKSVISKLESEGKL